MEYYLLNDLQQLDECDSGSSAVVRSFLAVHLQDYYSRKLFCLRYL